MSGCEVNPFLHCACTPAAAGTGTDSNTSLPCKLIPGPYLVSPAGRLLLGPVLDHTAHARRVVGRESSPNILQSSQNKWKRYLSGVTEVYRFKSSKSWPHFSTDISQVPKTPVASVACKQNVWMMQCTRYTPQAPIYKCGAENALLVSDMSN